MENPYPFGSKVNYYKDNVIGTVIDPSLIWSDGEDKSGDVDFVLVEFDKDTGGCFSKETDPDLPLKEGRFYRWFPVKSVNIKLVENVKTIQKIQNLRCVHCREGNDYAEPNMIDNRFCCHACRDAEGWRYREFYLEGVK